MLPYPSTSPPLFLPPHLPLPLCYGCLQPLISLCLSAMAALTPSTPSATHATHFLPPSLYTPTPHSCQAHTQPCSAQVVCVHSHLTQSGHGTQLAGEVAAQLVVVQAPGKGACRKGRQQVWKRG